MEQQPELYAMLVKREDVSPYARQIGVDIPRTNQKHPLFRSEVGKKILSRVLNAYALHDPQVGYVQGMNDLVSIFLLVVREEEEAFWLLQCYMQSMRAYYLNGMAKLQDSMARFGRYLQYLYPRLHSHFHPQGIEPFCYVTPWFLTLFSYNTPPAITIRLFDLFFLHLPSEEWVFRVGLAYLALHHNTLLAASFANIVRELKELNITESSLPTLLQTAIDLDFATLVRQVPDPVPTKPLRPRTPSEKKMVEEVKQ
eukprot:TRINITY_DN2010_c0_g2_i2.p1 TRINITY_DN2010_c0_g2~~TRINITY_DN2010_c0_g2_i2.p1  ORF type:complete len:255 (+),score=58.27 TRINITY_DN2010_c0_g2_i2:175-939(+)